MRSHRFSHAAPPAFAEAQMPSNHSFGAIGQRILLAGLMVIYFFVLNTLYIEFIYPVFGYTGFQLVEAFDRLPFAILSVIFATMFCTVQFHRPSDLFVNTVLLSVVVPTAVLYASGGINLEMVIITIAMHASLAMLRFVAVPVPNINFASQNAVLWGAQILTALAAIDMVYKIGLEEFSLDFVFVYERRAYAMSQLGTLDGYIIQLAMVANLVASLLAVSNRKFGHLVYALAIAVLTFGLIGSKTQIVLPFVAIATNYVLQRSWGMFAIYLFIVAFAVYLTYYYIYTDDPILLVANTFRRNGYMPVLINSFYMEYFSQAGFQYWSYSKLSLGLLQYRETLDTANLIGYTYFSNAESHANTGLIGSGYMNAGYFGIAFYTVVLGLMLAYVDRLVKRKGIQLLATILSVPLFFTVIMSGDLPSMVLSGGLGLVLVLLTVLKGNRNAAAMRSAGRRNGAGDDFKFRPSPGAAWQRFEPRTNK